jgi:hypothetical protein
MRQLAKSSKMRIAPQISANACAERKEKGRRGIGCDAAQRFCFLPPAAPNQNNG